MEDSEFADLVSSTKKRMESVIGKCEQALQSIAFSYDNIRDFSRLPARLTAKKEQEYLPQFLNDLSELHWHQEIALHDMRCIGERAVLREFVEIENATDDSNDICGERIDLLRELCREYKNQLDTLIENYRLKIST